MNLTNESIFVSALRGFFKSFAVVIGIGVALLLLILGISALSNSIETPDKSTLKLSSDANWNRKLLPDSSPVILRIDLTGVIGTGNNKIDKFREMLLTSREGALSGNRVKGIFLYINSPGGLATEISSIYQILKQYKEKFHVPIYAFVDGISASGGMYISCAADKIYATEQSIIGSVGVRLGPNFNVSDAMDKWGVKTLTLTEGKNKDALNPFRPWKEGEDAAFKAIMQSSYAQFLDVVISNRKNMDKEKLINDYGAKIFSAMQAQEYGYIDDGKASYDETLALLAKAAGIKEDAKYQVVAISPRQSVLKDLSENRMELLKGKIHHTFPIAPNLDSELSGQILYLFQP